MMEEMDALERNIALLEEQGLQYFDPVAYRYVLSIAQRAGEKPVLVKKMIATKVQRAIDDYQAKIEIAREQAKQIVDRLSADTSESADRLRALYERGAFNRVIRHGKKLNRPQRPRQLADLTSQLSQNPSLHNVANSRLNLEERLRRQEKDVLRTLSRASTGDGEKGIKVKDSRGSIGILKEALGKSYAENLVNDAILTRPENPGHLNKEMLATRSLAAMRKLSPEYLHRFVVYIDTLLCLEQR